MVRSFGLMRPEISTLGYLPLLYILVKPCPLLNVTLYFIQGKGAYLKRIGDSDWCFNSEVTARYPMQWYVDGKCVAGFANTMDKRSLCNAKFVSLKERVFLVSTKRIREGDEVMAYYKRAELARKNIKAVEKRAKGCPIRPNLSHRQN